MPSTRVRGFSVFAAVTLAALAVSGCSSPGGGGAVQQPKRIAFLGGTADVPFNVAETEAATAVFEAAGYQVDVLNAQYDPARQQTQCDTVTSSSDYAGIVIIPVGYATAVPCVAAARAADLPIVALEQQIGQELYADGVQVDGLTAQIFLDQRTYVPQWADLTLEACAGKNPCKVGLVLGDAEYPDTAMVRTLWDEQFAAHPQLQFAGEATGGFSNPDGGISATQNLVQNTPDLDVLGVADDETATGVVAELGREGLTDRIKVISNGGAKVAFDRIAAGTQYGVVVYTPRTAGTLAAETLVKAIAGEPIGKTSISWTEISPLGDGRVAVSASTLSDMEPEY